VSGSASDRVGAPDCVGFDPGPRTRARGSVAAHPTSMASRIPNSNRNSVALSGVPRRASARPPASSSVLVPYHPHGSSSRTTRRWSSGRRVRVGNATTRHCSFPHLVPERPHGTLARSGRGSLLRINPPCAKRDGRRRAIAVAARPRRDENSCSSRRERGRSPIGRTSPCINRFVPLAASRPAEIIARGKFGFRNSWEPRRGDRNRHEPLHLRQAARVMGGALPRQSREPASA
jgi:hypothetical protein